MRTWLLLGIVATGCWSDRAPAPTTPATSPSIALYAEPPPPPSAAARYAVRQPPRCRHVIELVFENAKDQMVRNGLSDALYAEMLEVAITSCEEQEWATDVLDCFEGAGSDAASAGCIERLSKDQKDDFVKRMTEVMQRSYTPPPSSLPSRSP